MNAYIKNLIRRFIYRSRTLSRVWHKLYVNRRIRSRTHILLYDSGKLNSIEIPEGTICDNLIIHFIGDNNNIIIGKNCRFLKTNEIYISGNKNSVIIGSNVIFDQNVSLVVSEGSKISIGDDCTFANGVRIRTSDQHRIFDSTGNRINMAKNVKIGNHVWLGASVIVMKGVSIGNNTVVGIDSMVTKDLPNSCVAVGKPARVIKNDVTWKL